MSEIEEIDVHISPDGRVRIEVRGLTGRRCEALTRDLEQILGGQVVDREYQDSYYQQGTDQTRSEEQDDRA